MKRPYWMSPLLFLGVLLHASSAFCSETRSANTNLNIINVADDFIAYYTKCHSADIKTRAAQWDIMLESKHQNFFNHALYRKKQGEDRESFKKARMAEFWNDIAPNMGKIAKLNSNANVEIKNVLTEFKKHFPDFDHARDCYITIAFGFKGKVVDVAGKNVFAIGLEGFGDDLLQLKITIAHEFFHLYHFQFFTTSGACTAKCGLKAWPRMHPPLLSPDIARAGI
jgi:hypothetical protein